MAYREGEQEDTWKFEEERVPTLKDAMQMAQVDGTVFVGGDEADVEVRSVVEGLHRRAVGAPAHTREVRWEKDEEDGKTVKRKRRKQKIFKPDPYKHVPFFVWEIMYVLVSFSATKADLYELGVWGGGAGVVGCLCVLPRRISGSGGQFDQHGLELYFIH